MATKTVILLLAVLVAVAAIAFAVPAETESEHHVRSTFIEPNSVKLLPNGQKAFDLLTSIVTPVVTATDQALIFTGQLFNSALGGLTNTLDVIENILTSKPLSATSTKGGPTVFLVSGTASTTAAPKP